MIFPAIALALLAAASPPFESVAQQAAAARESGKIPEALRLYQRGLELKPAWSEGWWYIGTLLYDGDRFAEAAPALARFVHLEPKSAAGWLLLGLCEFRTRRYDLSLQHLQLGQALGVPKTDPIGRVARYHRALLETRAGRFQSALDELKQFTFPAYESPQIIQAIGVAALHMPLLPEQVTPGQSTIAAETGRAVYDSWAANAAAASREYEQLVAKYPQNANIRYLYGSYLLQEHPEQGLQQLHRSLELDPNHVQAMLQIAFEALTRHDAAGGRPFAEKAARLDPQSYVAHNALGRILMEQGDLPRSAAELKQAVQLAPGNPECRFALATLYRRMNRTQDAARENAEFLRLKSARDDSPQ